MHLICISNYDLGGRLCFFFSRIYQNTHIVHSSTENISQLAIRKISEVHYD